MYLFLGWRPMQDRIGHLGHTIERCLWGDGRARHTFLLASTKEHPLFLIEIDVGDSQNGIKKSMRLNLVELDEIPKKIARIECLGQVKSPNAFDNLIESAQCYVNNHPNYHVLFNNCRTFVEYLIDQIPDLHNTIPRKNGSILEYYHIKAKDDHPGAIEKTQKLIKLIRDIQRHDKKLKSSQHIVFDIESSEFNMNSNDTETLENQK